ncbi:Monovalent cation/H+ antiporter subunit D OS=Stutzerimonas stutzeri OX=316 GN=CXK95_17175 PE=3 SV=1 [Stutzerimonas stutzeri]
MFWRTKGESPAIVDAGADPVRLLATLGLLSGSLLLVVLAQPVQGYLQATASQLLNLQPYLQTITGGGA